MAKVCILNRFYNCALFTLIQIELDCLNQAKRNKNNINTNVSSELFTASTLFQCKNYPPFVHSTILVHIFGCHEHYTDGRVLFIFYMLCMNAAACACAFICIDL